MLGTDADSMWKIPGDKDSKKSQPAGADTASQDMLKG